MLETVKFIDFEFISSANIEDVVDDIFERKSFIDSFKIPFLITPNVDYIVKCSRKEHKYIKDMLVRSMYVLPDGQPIVSASRMFAQKINNRLPGSDLFPVLWNRSILEKKRVLVLSSSELISEKLTSENPNVICLTMPMFNITNFSAISKLVELSKNTIIENDIDFVLIGLGFPKQDILAINIHEALLEKNIAKLPLFCMLGASFEFYLNLKMRAPKFMQNMGLEWLHRFASEPKRLFRRYMIDSIGFIKILLDFKKNEKNRR